MNVLDISNKLLQENTKRILILAGRAELKYIQDLKGGYVNNCYLLELNDDSNLVLKVWGNKSPSFVKQVICNTFFLSDHGFPTPQPLFLGKNNNFLFSDNLSWMLMPYIRGNWLSPETSSLYNLGIVQAKLHQIPAKADITTNYAFGYDFWEEMIENSLVNGEESYFIKLLMNELAQLKKNIPENLPKGIIHGDLKLENVIANKEKILSVLDLDDVCKDWLSLDLAMTFVHCCWNKGQPDKILWESLLDGYQSVRILDEVEKDALPHLMKFSILALAAWRYRQYFVKNMGKNLEKRFFDMFNRLNIDLKKMTPK